jgi:hypothetical protein
MGRRTENRQDSWRGDGTENRQDREQTGQRTDRTAGGDGTENRQNREQTGQLEEMGQNEQMGDRATDCTNKRQYRHQRVRTDHKATIDSPP